MTQIKKITDKQGNDIYLRTHTKAVIDDNGYTAESRMQAMQDEINQAQMELGAVPSDLTPTDGSSNWVTSGGLYNQLHVGDSYEEIDLSQFTEVNGWIDTSSVWNTTYKGIFIPVKIYEKYRIIGNLTGSGAYCFLTSDVVGSNGSSVTTIASGASRTAINHGQVIELTEIPGNAKYLWVGTSVSEDGDRKPQKIEKISWSKSNVKNLALQNQKDIKNVTIELSGEYRVSEDGMFTFKNVSSFGFTQSNRLFVAPSAGKYRVYIHMNDGFVIKNTTSKTRIWGVRVIRYDENDNTETVAGYDYSYGAKADDVEYIVTDVFDATRSDYALDFDLLENDIVFAIDRLSGSAKFSVFKLSENEGAISFGEKIDMAFQNIEEYKSDIEEFKSVIGNPYFVSTQTFVPATVFAMSQSVKIYTIPKDGVYKLRLQMNDGWTTTAVWNSSTRENIFSFRITSADYASGGTVIEYRNYAKEAFTNSQGVYIYQFEDELTWEREMTAGQCVYIITRLDGTGTVFIELAETLVDRIEYLENNAADENVSINDVATNKLDGEIAMIPKTLAVNTYTNMIMCFFSDIHGDTRNIQRVLNFCDYYNISCIIHGGDSVADYYGNGTPFTSETGALVMNVIGNHDSTNSSSNAYSNNVSDANLYNTFIAPFAESVVLPTDAATNGLCYWYKDYTSQGIRIIGINCMRWDSTQSTWLTNTLEDARTNDLSVIIVSHYPADDINGFDTGFNSRQWGPAYKGRTLYQFGTGVLGLVDSFITAGGEFICYLTGHQHRDHVGTCVHATNTQIQLTIDSSSTDRHANAIYGTTMGKYSIDFDIIGIDRYYKCIKVVRVGRNKDGWMREFKTMCIDYINGNLYNRYKIE